MLLLTLKQFDFGTNADGKRVVGENSPPVTTTLVTVLFGTAFLFFTEYLVNLFLTNYQVRFFKQWIDLTIICM